MYNVMLVDDEEEVRIAIEKKINWEDLGFQVVASAENGQDALEKALDNQPDVVLTDINMPFMNGLEFSKLLKSELPATRIVIFSGYDEFEYAKEAIELSAEEYILKPIDAEELKGVFSRLKNSLDEELDKRRNLENLKKYYQESVPFFKEQFIIGLIEGHIETNRIKEIYNEYGQGMEGNYYAVGIIRLIFDKDESMDVDSRRLFSVSLNQLALEKLSEHSNYHCVNYLGNVIVLGCFDSEEEYDNFLLDLDMICKLSSKLLQINTTAGVGTIVSELKDLFSSFKSAKDAISYRILFDDNQAISIRDVEPNDSAVNLFENDNVNRILKQIKIGSKADLSEEVNNFFMDLIEKNISLYQFKLSIIEAYFELFKLAKSYTEESTSFDQNIDVLATLDNFDSMDEMQEWFLEKCLSVRALIKQNRTDSTTLLINKAKEYISEHYNESELSVDQVCSYLGVSATYFSALFKKNTGVSFVTYLTNLRLEKAIELLNTTDEKSYVIGKMIGYDEPNYFSYVFKKAYGISPSKYRKQMEK